MNENNYYSNETNNNDYNNVYYNDEELNQNENKSKGLAIASLVLGILSIVLCCCGLGVFAAPLSIIFAIIALVSKKCGGKGMAAAGLIISIITIIFTICCYLAFGEYVKDYIRFCTEYPSVIEEYEETGELPDYIEKYRGEEFEDFFEASGYGDFDGFFEAIIDQLDDTLAINNFNDANSEFEIIK